MFWETTSCSPSKVNKHFGGKSLRLQGSIVSKPEIREKQTAGREACAFYLLHADFLFGLFFKP
jgi:hypothetical protein